MTVPVYDKYVYSVNFSQNALFRGLKTAFVKVENANIGTIGTVGTVVDTQGVTRHGLRHVFGPIRHKC